VSRFLTRRHFLALSTAATVAVPRSVASWDRNPGSGRTLRIGIIGMGRRGTELAGSVTDRSGSQRCEVVAVSNTRADWQDLVTRRDIDGVIVAAPDYAHAAISIAAMKSGKDVYCESPMARTIEEANAMKDVAASTGCVLQVGATGAFDGSWRAARAFVQEGRLGKLYWFQSSCAPRTIAEAPSWRDRWETSGGIATSDVFNRLAAMMTTLNLGVPDRVSVAGGVYAGGVGEIPDSFVVSLEYVGGPKLILTTAQAHRNGAATVLRGSKGTLYLDEATATFETERESVRTATAGASRVDLLDDWMASIRTRQSCAFGVDTAYPVMVAAAMANAAYRTARSVSFDAKESAVVPAPLRGERWV